MSNIIDYVKWRGDLSFSKSPFNEVDGLIFSKLAYLVFDNIVESGFDQDITLREFAEKEKTVENAVLSMLFMKLKDYEELLAVCAKSNRFGKCKLKNYVNIIKPEKELQFSAITFVLSNDKIVIAYRGTDDTIAGWKEDFNMGIMETVPSQIQAYRYLMDVTNVYKEEKIYIVGHSKGGNLAVYSTIYSPLSVNTRIEDVYNFDGPGFIMDLDQNKTYMRLLNRIHTLVPQSSIIGMLLDRKEQSTIIRSNATGGFMQHYGFTWEVSAPNSFERLEVLNKDSQIIDTTLKNFAATATVDQKRRLLNAITDIFKGYESYTLTELTADKMQVVNKLARNLDSLDKETKAILSNTLRLVFKEGINAVKVAGGLLR